MNWWAMPILPTHESTPTGITKETSNEKTNLFVHLSHDSVDDFTRRSG
jgi:hypothetical protein